MIYAKISGVIGIVLMLVWIGFYAGTLDGKERVEKAEAFAATAKSDADLRALQDQRTYEQKYQQAVDAYLAHRDDSQPVRTDPVRLCRPTPAKPAPALPGAPNAGRPDPGKGAGDDGNGSVDIRPAVNQFEKRWEEVTAQCRLLRDAWPQAPQTTP